MKEIYDEFIKSLETRELGDKIIFKDKTEKINKNNFKQINIINSNHKIAFIDGGNAEIIGASNFSLQLIRIYYTIYSNNKRILNKRKEYYILVKMVEKDDGLKYKIEFLNYKDQELHLNVFFNPFDKNLMEGNNRITPQRIAQHYRKLLELDIISSIIPLLNKGDLIVRDGDLAFEEEEECKIFEKIKKEVLLKEITLTGLSKTTTIITNTGQSIINTLMKLTELTEWNYEALNYNAIKIFFAKLNKKSRHAFRIDILEQQDADTAISLLKQNSTDITFPGYPYGLIEADNFARVSLKETENIKTIFLAQNQEFLEQQITSQNAHDLIS